MRLFTAALCTTVAAALLAACSGTGSSPSSALPGVGHASKVLAVGWHGQMLPPPPSPPRRLCTQQLALTSSNVLCYPHNDSGNGPPTCIISTGDHVNGFGSDNFSHLIIPNGFSGIQIYKRSCGALMYTIPDTLGQAVDAAAPNATIGHSIVVGHANGIVARCHTAVCHPLRPALAGMVQVAMDNSGNCWAATAISGLFYWAGCAGPGAAQAGFIAGSGSGGLDIDNAGNIVSTTQGPPSTITVYHCALNTCTTVTGPTSLNGTGDAVYCHLSKYNQQLACGNMTTGAVDIYSYLPTRVPGYLYSVQNDLIQADITEAGVFTPRSPL